ncbi:MAG: hypothetical protein OXL68_18600 [Paracoccaceae bacterium]|nr:hypothetical protein [Paracoccaceae bacterium]
MAYVLEPHFEATADRCRAEPVVLAIQDTTALNCSGLEATKGLDGIGGAGKGSVGILAHAGLAVTSEGRPLGLFAMDAAFREDPEEDSRRWVEGLGRERELAAACPDRVVSVYDREGDSWDLPVHGPASASRAGHLLPRSRAQSLVRDTVGCNRQPDAARPNRLPNRGCLERACREELLGKGVCRERETAEAGLPDSRAVPAIRQSVHETIREETCRPDRIKSGNYT